MKLAKKATIKNLQRLEDAIMARRDMLKHELDLSNNDSISKMFQAAKCNNDLAYIRNLMDDIECGRITEMEVN